MAPFDNARFEYLGVSIHVFPGFFVLVLVLSDSGTRTRCDIFDYEYEYHFIEYEYETKPNERNFKSGTLLYGIALRGTGHESSFKTLHRFRFHPHSVNQLRRQWGNRSALGTYIGCDSSRAAMQCRQWIAVQ